MIRTCTFDKKYCFFFFCKKPVWEEFLKVGLLDTERCRRILKQRSYEDLILLFFSITFHCAIYYFDTYCRESLQIQMIFLSP